MATGIFQKACPACAALLPREAQDCDCGYVFDAEEDGDETQQLAQEELFESYLSARLQQALADLEAARAVLAAAPTDTHKAHALLRRVTTLHQQRVELQAQQEKVAALRARVSAITASAPAEFRSVQAARAAQVVGAATRCAHCGAALTAEQGRCTCPAAASALLTTPDATRDDKTSTNS